MANIKAGLCQCGCGNPAPICTHTNRKRGVRKGEPLQFIYGHHFTLGRRIGRWNMRTQEERFFEKVRKTSGCWFWTGGNAGDGYGSFDQKRAHRISYEMFVAPIPEGKQVCHHCDTPLCVRPDHLFVGEPRDNSADMVAKGRSRRGQRKGG